VFLHIRAAAILLVTVSVAFGHILPQHRVTGVIIAVIMAAHLIIFHLVTRGNRTDLKPAYLATLTLDIFYSYLLIRFSGGLESFFFLGLYLIASLAAYILTRAFAAVIVCALTVMYCLAVESETSSLVDWFVVSVRVGLCWLFFFAISYIAEHLRGSEARMLKLFDTLNRRTSELEKVQAQLETIYDNSRVLAGILNVDEVIKSIMQIVNGLLRYPAAAILLRSGANAFLYRGRAIDGEVNLSMKPLTEEPTDLLNRVCKSGAPVRINDIRGNTEYHTLRPETRSVMLAPMTIRRKSIGALVAESSTIGAFSDRDEKMFWVVARSAAMALDNAMLHKQMEESSITDNLTGSFNYRYFSDKLAEEQRRTSRYNTPLSLIMLDLDHFKKINDTYGHEIGNMILRGVAQTTRECVRDTDILARYGGEEFAVILPQTPLSEARHIADRIRMAIEARQFDAGLANPRVSVTVSIGVSSFPENGQSQERLVNLADQALYRAKGQGRNAVAVI